MINEISPKNETKLSITKVFTDTNVLLLTITFALCKSVIYGIMLWVKYILLFSCHFILNLKRH